jgi:hypothetical protein
MRTIVLIVLIGFAINLNAQSSLKFVSSYNTVLKANGKSTNVNNNKKWYFHFCIYDSDVRKSFIHVSNQQNWYNSESRVQYNIYKIILKDNGLYYYWTTDVGQDGQIVLFIVDRNSSEPTIEENRYTPRENDNTILKIVRYVID